MPGVRRWRSTPVARTIIASYNASTGVLSLTGSNSPLNYQKVLRTLTYNNTTATPNPATRTISVSAFDGVYTSNVAVASLRYNIANLAPVAQADAWTVGEDGTLSVGGAGVLGNDSDPNSDPLTAELLAGPSNGTLSLSVGGTFTYTPNANFAGSDSFSYRAFDGSLYSGAALATITVTPVNDAPVGTATVLGAGREHAAHARRRRLRLHRPGRQPCQRLRRCAHRGAADGGNAEARRRSGHRRTVRHRRRPHRRAPGLCLRAVCEGQRLCHARLPGRRQRRYRCRRRRHRSGGSQPAHRRRALQLRAANQQPGRRQHGGHQPGRERRAAAEGDRGRSGRHRDHLPDRRRRGCGAVRTRSDERRFLVRQPRPISSCRPMPAPTTSTTSSCAHPMRVAPSARRPLP